MSYQKWTGYPDSPVTTEAYPYQYILNKDGFVILYCCSQKMYISNWGVTGESKTVYTVTPANNVSYYLNNGNWSINTDPQTNVTQYWVYASGQTLSLLQANNDIYTTSALTIVLFARTTPILKPIASIALNPLNNKQYIITLAGPAGEYQKWSGYPDSPVKTSDYPYQALYKRGDGAEYIYLKYSATPLYVYSGDLAPGYTRYLNGSVWSGEIGTPTGINSIIATNTDIYTDINYNTVVYPKTTPEAGTPIAPGETPKLSYTKGDILATDGGILQNILDYLITNNAVNIIPHLVSATTSTDGTKVILTFDMDMGAVTGKAAEFGIKLETTDTSLYQNWENYPVATDILLSSYPYQIVMDNGSGTDVLFYSTNKFCWDNSAKLLSTPGKSQYNETWKLHTDEAWGGFATVNSPYTFTGYTIKESNYDVYTDSSFTVVAFAKTTSDTITTTLPIASSELDIPLYQKWSVYPDSPVLTSDYPYQAIVNSTLNGLTWLLCDNNKMYCADGNYIISSDGSIQAYSYEGGVWVSQGSTSSLQKGSGTFKEANNPVYNSSGLTTTLFAKTTITDLKKVILSLNITVEYQKWSGYPDSPVKTSDYPYQYISSEAGGYLVVATTKFYINNVANNTATLGTIIMYPLNGANWGTGNQLSGSLNLSGKASLLQANKDIYTDDTLATVFFTKTTTDPFTGITSGQTIKTSYTKGTVTSALGGALESYADQAVTNAVPMVYQQWDGYTQSVLKLSDYPYQAIITNGYGTCLIGSKSKLYEGYVGENILHSGTFSGLYAYSGGAWVYQTSVLSDLGVTSILKSNYDIYANVGLTQVLFAKNQS